MQDVLQGLVTSEPKFTLGQPGPCERASMEPNSNKTMPANRHTAAPMDRLRKLFAPVVMRFAICLETGLKD